MNKMNVISHSSFGNVRSMVIKGEPWFVAKDVCDALEYTNNRKAISDHVDAEDRADVTISDGSQNRQITIINKSGLYSLIMKSRLEAAKSFQRWVTSEVLPSIRKHGYYINPEAQLSKSEQRRLERMMRESLNQHIHPEDIYKCHQKLRLPEDYINAVLSGRSINNAVMNDLQARALINRERYVDAYSPKRMQEVIKGLSK